jgi:hypothetical protein
LLLPIRASLPSPGTGEGARRADEGLGTNFKTLTAFKSLTHHCVTSSPVPGEEVTFCSLPLWGARARVGVIRPQNINATPLKQGGSRARSVLVFTPKPHTNTPAAASLAVIPGSSLSSYPLWVGPSDQQRRAQLRTHPRHHAHQSPRSRQARRHKSRDAGGARWLVECCSYQPDGLTFRFYGDLGRCHMISKRSYNTPHPRSNEATACICLIQNRPVIKDHKRSGPADGLPNTASENPPP